MLENWNNFVDSLQYMGIGMLSIFIVIGVIILLMTGLMNLVPKITDLFRKKQ